MIALDTNALVRLLVDSADAPEQSARVRALVADAERMGRRVYVGDVVLAELVWVLTRAMRVPRDGVLAAIESLLATPVFAFEDAEGISIALMETAVGGPGLADLLIVRAARRAGAEALYTFDRRMLKLGGVQEP